MKLNGSYQINLEKQNYQISLPKIKKNSQMDFFCWSSKDPLEINKYGIPEPSSNEIKYPDILLVPLVAYDNYLNSCNNIYPTFEKIFTNFFC